MKAKWFVYGLLSLVLLTSFAVSRGLSTVVTFDDLSETASGSFITSGYQGLVWSNFAVLNGILRPHISPFVTNGYYYGMVSVSNVAFNAFGNPAEIDSAGTKFNFLDAYLTGAWNSNLNIEVQGFNGATMLYDTTVVASATSPTVFNFNYLNIDRLYFNSFGGQSAGFSTGSGEHFVMDNFSFEFVPEPSAFLLTAAGALMLWSVAKRKRD